MICVNAIRVKQILKDKEMLISDLEDKFILKSYHTVQRLNSLLHESTVKMKYPDSFVYELARELEVSVDYLLGWTEEPDIFIPSVGNEPYHKQREIVRMLNKYCLENNIDRRNSNILAYKTNIDREVFELLFKGEKECAWWITTSYYIISRLAQAFDFNFFTVMAYCLQQEDDDGTGDEFTRHLSERYENEFNIKTI